MLLKRNQLLPLLIVLALPAIVFAADIRTAYDAILNGDYSRCRQALENIKPGQSGEADTKQLQDWLAEYDSVSKSRESIRRQTFDWSVEQSQKALADGKTYLALTFATRAVPYGVNDDPYADAKWVDELIVKAEEDAQKLIKEDKWMKAYAYYALLSKIRPNDERLEKLSDDVAMHARIETVYKDQEEFDRRISGVSYYMFLQAATMIKMEFYREATFKEIAESGLDNLTALAETAKLREYLDGLGNDEARGFFVEQIAELKKKLEQQEAFGHDEFINVFKAARTISSKSVRLPEPLLIIEFLDGALAELDPYTTMIWPVDVAEFRKMMMGNFEGVGIQLGIDEYTKRLKVETPLPGAPAIKCGIQAGDLIIKVDGEDTSGWTTRDAVRNITGEAGTKVVLTMFRPSTGKYKEFTVRRGQIELKTVRGVNRLNNGHSEKWNYIADPENGIALIQLTAFQENSADELRAALREANKQGMKGLILDLRGNTGGLLNMAIEIVGIFVPKGKVVSTDGRAERKEVYPVFGNALYPDLPLIVLVNGGSASASEIVAGALKDNHRAVVLGNRTFGKGSVQRIYPIPHSGAQLKMTTALYYLPSGRSPHKMPDADVWGVDPDVELKLMPKELVRVMKMHNEAYVIRADVEDSGEELSDEQQAALDGLMDNTQDEEELLLTEKDVELIESDPIKVKDVDAQLETALLHMRVKLVAGLPWPTPVAAIPMKDID